MYGKSYDIRSPARCLGKIPFCPLSFRHKLYRIGEAKSSEYDLISLMIDELVALYLYPCFLSRL
jgi:hypothetical protein